MLRDDLGTPVEIPDTVNRIVSLVPSLTESIARIRPDALVGATDWCTHPADLNVVRIRGTKNPNRDAIAALEPDLVLANKEENREIDVRRLREAGLSVWVTEIETVSQAFASLARLFALALRWDVPEWLVKAEEVWSDPAPAQRIRVAVPIWRDPWMVVGRSTFAGDLIARLGLENIFDRHIDRYPKLPLNEIDRSDLDLVLLPDEPYPFTSRDGPEAFHKAKTMLVSGRLLTWYGPSLVTARQQLLDAVTQALGTR